MILKPKDWKWSHQLVLILVVLMFTLTSRAQNDSLILKKGNVIVGEIKILDKGVLTIETNYSKSDFTIEWSGVKEFYSKTIFLISLKDGRRIDGSVWTIDAGNMVTITTSEGEKIETLLDDIVVLKGLKSNFWTRFRADVDMGLSFSKANNLRQLTLNSDIGYIASKFQLDAYFNATTSSQDSVETTKRKDAGITYKYFLQKNWYLLVSPSFLSNTEQALKLRSTGKLGGGKFFVHTNRSYWGAGGGLSFNVERFTNETPKRESLEAYIGTELNRFDIGDIDLLSSLYIYPSLTESGRLRYDFRFDSKYDLPWDFYIKLGLTLNYDNKPAVEGNKTDYVLGFTVGWELE